MKQFSAPRPWASAMVKLYVALKTRLRIGTGRWYRRYSWYMKATWNLKLYRHQSLNIWHALERTLFSTIVANIVSRKRHWLVSHRRCPNLRSNDECLFCGLRTTSTSMRPERRLYSASDSHSLCNCCWCASASSHSSTFLECNFCASYSARFTFNSHSDTLAKISSKVGILHVIKWPPAGCWGSRTKRSPLFFGAASVEARRPSFDSNVANLLRIRSIFFPSHVV